ncbi:hypothetical protein NBN67_19980 [Clostridioides difficile]|uniref:hypothetical protein n=1 Tax=Clostridioides difficile TaxID=1496 RepID=UPI00202DDB92|nr:hypothetical protein [Clostridioides difficile]MCM0739817.1 hypothetical protein [Clostridioides difficile]HBF2930792.1 hypothetical protein [Clostridioides difficile]HBF2935777.1 hypothetical protein [Clostridioides difficile]HBZ0282972.1 hypothetical protein [Clostridioides difficile]
MNDISIDEMYRYIVSRGRKLSFNFILKEEDLYLKDKKQISEICERELNQNNIKYIKNKESY